MKYLLCILIGYLVGTINPSYIIAKIRGFDIREKGSKNAGASNALILCLVIPVMFFKHKENLKRIKQKTEMPFSFLWNKEKALEKTNIPKG